MGEATTTSKGLVARGEQALAQPPFTPGQIALLKSQIAPGSSDDELSLFMHVCRRTGLDPFVEQIYAIRRREKRGNDWVEKMVIQTGIDGYRLIAERSGQYEGQTPPQWCDASGGWRDVWTKSEPPAAARVGIYRTGFRDPAYGVAHYAAYVAKSSAGAPVQRWAADPAGMIAKCAEALALRKAFPQELSGLLVDAEVEREPVDVPAAIPPPRARATAAPSEQGAAPVAVERPFDALTVLRVSTKTGAKKSGDPWTLYTVHFSDGAAASTFSETLADMARTFAGSGESVVPEIEVQGNNRNLTGLSAEQP